MKVALVGPYPLDPQVLHGGVEASTFYLAEGLRQRDDVELHVFSLTKKVQKDMVVERGGITVHYLAEPKRRVVPNLITNVGRLRRAIYKWRPDIVHAEHPCGALAGIKGRYPTAFTIHGVIHCERRYARGGFMTFLNQSLLDYLTRQAVSRSNYVIPVSSYVANEYAPLIKGHVRVIPNAMEDRFFRIAGAEAGARLLYVGFIGPRKNILGLVRAFRLVLDRVPGAELLIAGGVNDELYFKQVKRLISELDMVRNVQFLGLLDQPALEKQYLEASLVCISSLHETFSLTVSQGMAAGKPVVSTDSGGPSDLIDDGLTGFLVPVGDEGAFAARCVELLADAELRHKMGEEARKVALARFSKEIVAQITVEVYKEMLR